MNRTSFNRLHLSCLMLLGFGSGAPSFALDSNVPFARSDAHLSSPNSDESSQGIWSLKYEAQEREWLPFRPLSDTYSLNFETGGMTVPYEPSAVWFVGVEWQAILDHSLSLGLRSGITPLRSPLVVQQKENLWEQTYSRYGFLELQAGSAWQARWGPTPILFDLGLLGGTYLRDQDGVYGWQAKPYVGLISALTYGWFGFQAVPRWHEKGAELALSAAIRVRWQ